MLPGIIVTQKVAERSPFFGEYPKQGAIYSRIIYSTTGRVEKMTAYFFFRPTNVAKNRHAHKNMLKSHCWLQIMGTDTKIRTS